MQAIPSTKKTVKAVEHAITRVTTKLDDLELPRGIKSARKAMAGWQNDGRLVVKKHPLRSVFGAALGAFAAGVALTAFARRR